MQNSRHFGFSIDEQSFEQMYYQHWEKMYSLAFFRVGDRDIAKELVQNVFVSVWERRHSLVIEGEVSHYLLRAVKLKILEHYRTEQQHERHLGELALQQERQEDSTENSVLFNELRGRLQQLASTLPDQCRRVFELSRFHGLNTREISLEMVISEKTVKNHLTRALSSMRVMLQ